MNNLGQCQIEGCNRPAVYSLYKILPKGEKVWCHVCEHHEQMIGDENIHSYANQLSLASASLMREGRDSKGHFIKGNVPHNKRVSQKSY